MKFCKYYYDLEEKFTSRAGICPKNTSDNLFVGNSTLMKSATLDSDEIDFGTDDADQMDEEQGESEDGPNTAVQVDQPHTPAAASSRKKPAASNKSSKGKSKKAKMSQHAADSMDYMIASLCKTAMEKNKRQNTEVAQKVELSEQFKKMSDALGSKIRAAYQCEEFVVLLDKKERKELKKYTKEQEEESSDSDGSESN
jgi:hypothetical protein